MHAQSQIRESNYPTTGYLNIQTYTDKSLIKALIVIP